MKRWFFFFLPVVGLATLHCKSDDEASADKKPPETNTVPDAATPFDAGADTFVPATLPPTDPKAIMASADKDEDPSLIHAIDGSYYLAFYSNRDGNDRIWLARSPDGVIWTTPRAVTDTTEHAFYPSLAQTADGYFHLAWWAGDVGDGGKIVGRIRYAKTRDTVALESVQSLTDNAALAWAPSLTVKKDGGLFLAWSSDASGDKDIYTSTSTTGGVTWSTPNHLTNLTFNDDLPYATTEKDGTLVMVWQHYAKSSTSFDAPTNDGTNDLVWATSPDGVVWSTPTPFVTDPPQLAIPDITPSLYPSDDSTGFSVAWASARAGSTGDIFSLGLSAGPASDTNVKRLTTTGGYSPKLVSTGATNNYVMVWVKDLDIWSRRL